MSSPSNSALQSEVNALKKALNHMRQGPYSDIDSGKYTDFTVKCFEKIFTLHSSVICPHSPFFAAALRPSGDLLEIKTAHVELPEEDPQIFKMFLQLVYLGDLDSADISKHTVMDHVKLYVMCDKYGSADVTERAHELAQPKILNAFHRACYHGNATIASNQWDIFADAVEFLYANVPSSSNMLRLGIVRSAALAWRDPSVKNLPMRDFLKAVPDFAVEVLSMPWKVKDPVTDAKSDEGGITNATGVVDLVSE